MVEYRKHYLKNIDPIAEKQLELVLDFFKKENLAFYNITGPLINERSEGSQRYIDVNVSIKLS